MKTVIRIKLVILFAVLLWSAAFLLLSDHSQDSLYRFILLIECLIFSVGLLLSLVNHSISERGIQVCFFSLPVRTIPWEKVKHAIYVHTWRDPRTRYHWGPVHGQIILRAQRRDPVLAGVRHQNFSQTAASFLHGLPLAS